MFLSFYYPQTSPQQWPQVYPLDRLTVDLLPFQLSVVSGCQMSECGMYDVCMHSLGMSCTVLHVPWYMYTTYTNNCINYAHHDVAHCSN